MIKKLKRTVATCGFMLLTAGSAFAFGTTSTEAVVTTADGQPVANSAGNCVRTRWENGQDYCNAVVIEAKVQPPAPVVVPAPAPVHIYTPAMASEEDRTVYFAFNDYGLTPQAQQKLDSLSDILKSSSNVKAAHIVGFADRLGSTNYNEALSHKRAEAVKNYIVSRGYVNTDVAETRWVGKSQPSAVCAKNLSRIQLISCLQQDRKVEVEIEVVTPASVTEQR